MNGEGRVLCTCTFMYPKGASTGTGCRAGEGRDGTGGRAWVVTRLPGLRGRETFALLALSCFLKWWAGGW